MKAFMKLRIANLIRQAKDSAKLRYTHACAYVMIQTRIYIEARFKRIFRYKLDFKTSLA